jgi:hypothetical protein
MNVFGARVSVFGKWPWREVKKEALERNNEVLCEVIERK